MPMGRIKITAAFAKCVADSQAHLASSQDPRHGIRHGSELWSAEMLI